MKKVSIISAVALILAAAIAPSYAWDDLDDENLRVFQGRVVNVDVGKSLLTVKSGEIMIVFPILSDTKLVKDAFNIKLSEIEAKDYVAVSYLRSGSDSRVPLKVTRVSLEYDDSKQSQQ